MQILAANRAGMMGHTVVKKGKVGHKDNVQIVIIQDAKILEANVIFRDAILHFVSFTYQG